MYFFKIIQWALPIFVGLWSFGFLQAQEMSPCSYLQDQTKSRLVCISSGEDSTAIKIDLRAKIRTQNIDSISSVRFHPDESIAEVDLSDNPRLTALPAFIFDLPNLVQLDISNTGISDWGSEICQLKKLEKLIGAKNLYADNEIPFHTFCLENLQVLDLSYSYIWYVDEYIGKLTKLRELLLRNHQLSALPLMLYELRHLEKVDLRSYLSLNSKLTSLYSCENFPEENKEDCRESLLDDIRCEYHAEIPFERGDGSFRKIYADMAGFSLEVFEDPNNSDLVDEKLNSPDNPRLLLTDQCYIMWLGGMDYEGQSSHMLGKTIGGRTIRELRYIHDIWFEWDRSSITLDFLTSIFTLGMAGDSACGLDFIAEDRTKLPFWSLEVFPERFVRIGFSVWMRNLLQEYWGIYDENWWVPHCSHIPDFEEHVEPIKTEINDWSLLEKINKLINN
ncbi:MAG: leucine-rich repeat domain-containing protein [Bdellovibrionales bacterium]|nr:leucine-rich repeat domain-containing protein [Bdellovibrionales bacterium]